MITYYRDGKPLSNPEACRAWQRSLLRSLNAHITFLGSFRGRLLHLARASESPSWGVVRYIPLTSKVAYKMQHKEQKRDGGAVLAMKCAEKVRLCAAPVQWQVVTGLEQAHGRSQGTANQYADALRAFKDLNIYSSLHEDWNEEESKWKGVRMDDADLTEL